MPRPLLLLPLLSLGLCQRTQTLYGQCGGKDYDGPQACPSAAYCVTDGNEYYSQCQPAAVVDAEASAASESAASASEASVWSAQHPGQTQTIGTIFSDGGSSVVSTFVTIITQAPDDQQPPPDQPIVTLTPDPSYSPDEPYTPDWAKPTARK